MENILMRFFRETQKHTPDTVAAHLGITVHEYQEIETGQKLLSEKQAKQLGKLFGVKGQYICEAALQLDLLITRNEMVKIYKAKVEELKEKIQELKNSSKV
jgi:plasmid maintenance system antidote protein VapI